MPSAGDIPTVVVRGLPMVLVRQKDMSNTVLHNGRHHDATMVTKHDAPEELVVGTSRSSTCSQAGQHRVRDPFGPIVHEGPAVRERTVLGGGEG